MIFQVTLDPQVVLASVNVLLGDATMNGITLDYRTPTATFDLAAGPCRAAGSLMLRINDAPFVSTVYLDAVVTSPPAGDFCRTTAAGAAPAPVGSAFRGDLLQWRTPIQMVLARTNRFVSRDVLLQVDVIANPGPQVQAARVRFLYAGQYMAEFLLHQNPPVTITADIRSGTATIKAGATLSLLLPSGVADGNVTATNLILVSGTDTIDLSGVLATWPPPPAGPPPGAVIGPAPDAGTAPVRPRPRPRPIPPGLR